MHGAALNIISLWYKKIKQKLELYAKCTKNLIKQAFVISLHVLLAVTLSLNVLSFITSR